MTQNYNIFTEYEEKVLKTIKEKLQNLKITQKKLSDITEISQPTLSKLFCGKTKFTLEQLARISYALKLDIAELVSFSNTNLPFQSSSIASTHFIPENDNLVCTTNRPAFKGYIGNTYYIYFYSTISSEIQLIHGTLSLTASAENKCIIDLEIYTGQTDVSGNRIKKAYTGDMIISVSLGSCYCSLFNAEIGELCFLSFHHMFLFSQDILCRLGAVLTTSSGGNRRPTLHRMVISKSEFDLTEGNKDLHFLKGQLKLNSSKILVSKNDFQKLLKESNLEQDNELKKFFSTFETLASQNEYYEIDESALLGMTFSVDTKIYGINLLREVSAADKYNKISTKSDEFLFEYISKKTVAPNDSISSAHSKN